MARITALTVSRTREIPTAARMVISRDPTARTGRTMVRIRTVRADPRAVRVTIRTVVRLVLVLIIRIVRELLIRGSVLRRKRKKATENCFLCWRCWCW